MAPIKKAVADRVYTDREEYRLGVIEERSQNSHNHFFAMVAEAWENLPEDRAARFPTSEHLRKYCLIKSGYADERSIVTASNGEALRVAAFIKPMDTYAIVTVSGPVVRVYTAKSQSRKAMGAKDFQASKTAVLDMISALIGVTPAQLEKASA